MLRKEQSQVIACKSQIKSKQRDKIAARLRKLDLTYIPFIIIHLIILPESAELINIRHEKNEKHSTTLRKQLRRRSSQDRKNHINFNENATRMIHRKTNKWTVFHHKRDERWRNVWLTNNIIRSEKTKLRQNFRREISFRYQLESLRLCVMSKSQGIY